MGTCEGVVEWSEKMKGEVRSVKKTGDQSITGVKERMEAKKWRQEEHEYFFFE